MKVINQWKDNNKHDFIFELFSIDWSSKKTTWMFLYNNV